MDGSNVTVRPGASADPVFVLCAGRSGSTLLRFMLDSHPNLACPPETNLPALCVQLATVWSLIEGAPLSGERGDEPPEIPAAAIKGIRRTVDEMLGSYLARRGKRRYCDKSLGTARYAGLLRRVYPEAKFLCLYRHPMDVIASGLEACPWGLAGYGFDAYIASTPGNMVLALARFWADNTAGIHAVEEQFPDACHRVRYEDLVADPQRAADDIFAFLGVSPVPGIAARCFSAERERFGPADHKIWHTSRVTTGSVGRGWEIPAAMIPPPVLEQINGLTDNLGYLRVDDTWGTASPPADPLEPFEQPAAGGTCPAGITRVHSLIADRLRAGLGRLDDRFSDRWSRCREESFGIVATPSRGGEAACWRVDPTARTVTRVQSTGDESAWDIVGSAAAWERLLNGDTNFSVALRKCELRYCDAGDAGPVAADSRIGMLADLLSLTSWPARVGESRLTDAAVLS